MQKKTLIFDLGNVIINLKPEYIWFKEDLLPNFDTVKLHQLQLNNFFNDFETGKITSTEFLNQLKKIAKESSINDDEISQFWNGILLDIPSHRIELLYQLKKNYNLLLLSNTNVIHLDFIIQYIHQHYGKNVFDEIFIHQFYSQKLGLRKPNAAIYDTVLQLANINPKNTTYFFDDKEENLIEPKKLGIQTVLVDKDIFLQELRLFL